MHECGGPLATFGGTSGCCTFPPTPTNTGGNEGGGIGNNNSNTNAAIRFSQNFLKFNATYGTNLLDDYEEQAYECYSAANFAAFETCVKDAIIAIKINQIHALFGITLSKNQLFKLASVNGCDVFATDFIECAMKGVSYIDTGGDAENELLNILPYSCETFDFVAFPGVPTRVYSKVTDLSMSFVEFTPIFKIYRFKISFEVLADNFFDLNCYLQNEFASELNIATSLVTSEWGFTRKYRTGSQSQLEADFKAQYQAIMDAEMLLGNNPVVHCPTFLNITNGKSPESYIPGFAPDCCE